MPKAAPKLGGTEMDLEKQIEDDLLNLNLDTEDFGVAAMEADEKASKASERSQPKKSSVVKAS